MPDWLWIRWSPLMNLLGKVVFICLAWLRSGGSAGQGWRGSSHSAEFPRVLGPSSTMMRKMVCVWQFSSKILSPLNSFLHQHRWHWMFWPGMGCQREGESCWLLSTQLLGWFPAEAGWGGDVGLEFPKQIVLEVVTFSLFVTYFSANNGESLGELQCCLL